MPFIEPPPLPTPPDVFPTQAPPPPPAPEPPTGTPEPPPTGTPVPPTPVPPTETATTVPTHTPSGAMLTAIAVSSLVPTATPTHTRTHTPTVTTTPTASVSATVTPSWLPPGPECVQKPGKTVLKLDVPYLHQVMDVGGADGNWACGPTSVVMVLAYYGKLEPWRDYMLDPPAIEVAAKVTAGPSTTPRSWAAEPSQAAVDYAPYVTGVFTAGGHLYDDRARDPRGNMVAGLYGNIAPTGYADWGRMRAVFERQGLQTQHVGASWNAVVAALKRGHPVLIGNDLTPEGHILVAVGYTNKNQLIVNDPYGNRFTPGYGGTMGKEVVYPWNCMRAQNALEVIGTYPPEPRPSRTPTATTTGTPTDTPTVTNTPTITPTGTATPRVTRTSAPHAAALAPRTTPTTAPYGAYIAGATHVRERVPSALELAAPRLLGLSVLVFFALGFGWVAFVRRGRGRAIRVPIDDEGP